MTKASLPPVEKRYATTLIGGPDSGRTRRECWGARTVDGEWDIERQDDVGTPWQVFHIPSGSLVPYVFTERNDAGEWETRASNIAWQFGTLKAALEAIADGRCRRALDLLYAQGGPR